jgi:hypothetical protein
MLLLEVILPNKCNIARVIDTCDSLHVYEGSLGDAEKVLREERVRNPGFVERLDYKYAASA